MDNHSSKYCIHCGKEIPSNVDFCPFCGTKQSLNNQADEPLVPKAKPVKPNMISALKLGFTDMFSIKKRMSRADFWWLYLDILIIGIILNIILGTTFEGLAYSYNTLWFVFLFIISIIYSMSSVIIFTSEIRRLHDTNKSGHFLWLLLIPLVGPILTIIFLAQRSNDLGSRFDGIPHTKPWFKKWWTWLILVVCTFFTTIALNSALQYVNNYSFYQSSLSNNTGSNGTATTASSSTSDETSTTSSDDDTLNLGDSDLDIADSKVFDTDSTQTWAGSTFDIDKVTIYQTDGDYTQGSGKDKKTINGVVKVHMEIDAGRDISAYPTQATLSTSDGQQVDADMTDSDDFDGDLDSGTQTDGNIYFLLPSLDEISDLSDIRLKWSADYDTDDYDDDNDYKDFDVTLQLNQ
ncbi:DUF805 domain-containing protein [Levilactobacillus brevis]|uniref:DUF805 domain-containing protein n=1 Tax=Levilactobacillus brevis TaxID=1580 RepID=UPI000A20B5B9|nr:DUF805 domain-containing protein [Levilactobacillus brevis]ARN90035.1 hypothetical protein AZI09_05695 [Levilactobacillus brevis]ARN97672.1 hypothetical protein AZI10_06035 [Levilactobacillus brevis]TOY85145.1 DUF805 domain-containing protein [Levilactobacillus brevis]HJE00080.1 DUF805 domain-containing protein [Levilactobacillus brevis]